MNPSEFIILLLMELGGALVGAFYGVKWGYEKAAHHEREKRKEEIRDEHDTAIKSLIEEINSNKNDINKMQITREEGELEFYIGSPMSVSAFRSIVQSGTFRLFSPPIQKIISYLYIMFDNLHNLQNMRLNHSLQYPDNTFQDRFIRMNAWKNRTKWFQTQLVDKIENLKKIIPIVIKDLENEIINFECTRAQP